MAFRMKHAWLPALCMLVLTTSCERRELTYYMESEISITADWSRADLEEEESYGATLIIYPKDGDKPQVVLMGERERTTVRLPRGKYDAILFNRSFDDFRNLLFRGGESIETLEAYAKQTEVRTGTRIITAAPDKLASAMIQDFEVTENMLGNYAPAVSRTATCPEGACRIKFTPKLLTRKVQVKLHIQGINNLRQATCRLNGVPISIFLHDGSPGHELGIQEFTAKDVTLDEGSRKDGTLTGMLNLFGFDPEMATHVTLQALLVDDKTIVEQQIGNVKVQESTDGSGIITLYLEAAGTEPLPDVKPSGSTDSGFNADVDEWGDETVTEMPI